MRSLPSAERVRELRKLAERCDAAAMVQAQCDSYLTALRVLTRQLELSPITDGEAPGQTVLDSAIDQFPELEPVRDIGPRPDDDLAASVRKRAQQLESVKQMLDALARQGPAHHAEVHRLQHEQQHTLAEPGWSDLRDALTQHYEVRQEAQRELTALQVQAQMLEAPAATIAAILPQVRGDIDASATDPERLALAAARLSSLLTTLKETTEAVGLQARVPDPAPLTSGGQEAIEAILTALAAFDVAVVGEATRLRAEIVRTKAIFDDSTSWITDRTG